MRDIASDWTNTYELGTTLTADMFSHYYAKPQFAGKNGGDYQFHYYGLNEVGEPILRVEKWGTRKYEPYKWHKCKPTKELINAYKWA